MGACSKRCKKCKKAMCQCRCSRTRRRTSYTPKVTIVTTKKKK